MADKPVVWIGSAKAELKAFPENATREAGYVLWLVQLGLSPPDWRPMPDVGAGVAELRISVGTDHRVFYVAKFDEAIYVLHAFEKRSRKTSRQDIDVGRKRYREVIARRATKAH